MSSVCWTVYIRFTYGLDTVYIRSRYGLPASHLRRIYVASGLQLCLNCVSSALSPGYIYVVASKCPLGDLVRLSHDDKNIPAGKPLGRQMCPKVTTPGIASFAWYSSFLPEIHDIEDSIWWQSDVYIAAKKKVEHYWEICQISIFFLLLKMRCRAACFPFG